MLIGSAVALASLLYAARAEPTRRDSAPLPPLVDAITVGEETVTEWFTGYGTAQPLHTARVAAEVSCRVMEIPGGIRSGSRVESGQLVIRLDDSDYHHQLRRAEAFVAADEAGIDELVAEARQLDVLIATAEAETQLAKNEWDRVADLFERQLAAEKEHDFANLAYQQSRRVLQGYQRQSAQLPPRRAGLIASRDAHVAEVEQAKIRMERCRIRAPFSGALKELKVEVGDWVSPGFVVLTLIDPSHVEIALQVPASVYDRVRIGASSVVTSESMPGVSWEGSIARISPSVDAQSRTFAAYVEVDNTRHDLPCVPGVFVRAKVEGDTYEDALIIPRGAIREGFVFVSQGGVAKRKRVEIERCIGDRAVVSGELAVGNRLILSRLSQLSENDAVRVDIVEDLIADDVDLSAPQARVVEP